MLPEGGHLHETDSTIFFIAPQNVKANDDATESWLEESGDAIDAFRIFPLQQQCQTEVCESLWQVRCYAMDPEDKQYGLINDDGGLVRVRFRVTKEATQAAPPQYSLDVERLDDKGVIRSIVVTMDLRYAFRDEDRFAVIDFDSESSCSLSLQFESQDDLLRFESVICKVVDSTAGNVYAWDNVNDSVQDILDPELEKRYADYREMDAALFVCLNIVQTRKVQSVRRGAVVKALAVVTSRRYVEMFRPLLSKALDEIFIARNDEQVLSFLNQLHAVLSTVQCPTVQASPLHTRVIRGLCGYGTGCPFSAFEVPLAGESFTLKLPIVDIYEDELGGVSIVELVRIFGESVMILYNGIFLGRRVLFLGHNMAASLVSRLVLAAAAMVRPLSAGVLHRLFPYAHLTNLTFLQTPGFIAGVTNPIFANHWEWFDILADIKQGTVQLSSQQANQASVSGANVVPSLTPEKLLESSSVSHESIDLEMYAQMTSAGTATFGEEYTRAVFYDHTLSLLDQVVSKELFRDDTRRRYTFDGNSARLSEYRAAKHHDYHDVSVKCAQRHSLFGRHFNTIKTSARLLQVRRLPSRQLQNIFEEIASRLITEEHVWQLLDLLPECRSGLLPIAISLFGQQFVQKAAFDLLERIESTGVGAKAIDQLPLMLLMAYRRLKREKKESQRRESTVLPDYIQQRDSFSRLRPTVSASFKDSPSSSDISRLTFPNSSLVGLNATAMLPMSRTDLNAKGVSPEVVISMVRQDTGSSGPIRPASLESDFQAGSSDDDAIDNDANRLMQQIQSDDSAYARSDIGSED